MSCVFSRMKYTVQRKFKGNQFINILLLFVLINVMNKTTMLRIVFKFGLNVSHFAYAMHSKTTCQINLHTQCTLATVHI